MTIPSVEAYINLDGTGYTISDKGGMFPCDLYGEVVSTGIPGDFDIISARVGSEHVTFTDELTGDRLEEAKAILVKDNDWLEWAIDQTGYSDPDSRRPAGGDVGSRWTDAGARL